MATTFKTLLNNDIVSTRTILHEAIPITGTIASGTYSSSAGGEENIKNYGHGMFQSVYDYPYLSSSANHIFDLTCGYSSGSILSGSSEGNGPVQNAKKIAIYQQMSQMLMGYNSLGEIREFDVDGNFHTNTGITVSGQNGFALGSGGQQMKECYFFNFSRLLCKDEIKKGSFHISFVTGGVPTTLLSADVAGGGTLSASDYAATGTYYVNSPAGEYGILYTSSMKLDPSNGRGIGLVFYQAGILVLSASAFSNSIGGIGDGFAGNLQGVNGFGAPDAGPYESNGVLNRVYETGSAGYQAGSTGQAANSVDGSTPSCVLSGATIAQNCDALRNRLNHIQFNNTVELNSTIYFCRANHNEFNYSSNPTYLSSSKLVTKNKSADPPVSYMTSVGLYSADNELLAVAKLSEPIKKDPSTELTLRVRLDY